MAEPTWNSSPAKRYLFFKGCHFFFWKKTPNIHRWLCLSCEILNNSFGTVFHPKPYWKKNEKTKSQNSTCPLIPDFFSTLTPAPCKYHSEAGQKECPDHIKTMSDVRFHIFHCPLVHWLFFEANPILMSKIHTCIFWGNVLSKLYMLTFVELLSYQFRTHPHRLQPSPSSHLLRRSGELRPRAGLFEQTAPRYIPTMDVGKCFLIAVFTNIKNQWLQPVVFFHLVGGPFAKLSPHFSTEKLFESTFQRGKWLVRKHLLMATVKTGQNTMFFRTVWTEDFFRSGPARDFHPCHVENQSQE